MAPLCAVHSFTFITRKYEYCTKLYRESYIRTVPGHKEFDFETSFNSAVALTGLKIQMKVYSD